MSLTGINIAQVNDDGNDFVYANIISTKSAAGLTLGFLCDTFDIPNKLVCDMKPDQVGLKTHFNNIFWKFHIKGHHHDTYCSKKIGHIILSMNSNESGEV